MKLTCHFYKVYSQNGIFWNFVLVLVTNAPATVSTWKEQLLPNLREVYPANFLSESDLLKKCMF